jgi:hypothetical protein
MATIIKVHGTFNNGIELGDHGDRWWQEGSEFWQELSELVVSESGELKFERCKWGGENSATTRWSTGNALLDQMQALERQGEKYCVIGHSHGGSVIAAALVTAAKQKLRLPGLSRWLTVGTPFLQFQKRGLLFSRLDLWGKALYLTFLALGLLYVGLAAMKMSGRLLVDIIALTVPLLPFVLAHAFFWSRDRKRFSLFRPRVIQRAKDMFQPRWISFRHERDEAILGLGVLPNIDIPIFSKAFIAGPLSTVLVFLAPAILLAMIVLFSDLSSASLLDDFNRNLSQFSDREEKTAFVMGLIATAIATLIVFYVLSVIVVLVAHYPSTWLSAFLSGFSNRQTWHQIRQSAFGNDSPLVEAVAAGDRPVWSDKSSRPLPNDVADELTSLADDAARAAVSKLRDGLQILAFAEGNDQKSKFVANYLTWDELVHTTYFKVPRFRKLVAYAIAQSPGFRASAKFMSDPDYATAARWYEHCC